MSETKQGSRARRKFRVTAESAGKRLAIAELLRRGIDARLAGEGARKHDVLVCAGDSPPKAIQVKTVHSAPWYVRRASFEKRADQVTVYVLLGAESMRPARFFVATNRDLASQFRQPPTWKTFGLIDVKAVEQYEDNWDTLR
jgi:hypothetical protein